MRGLVTLVRELTERIFDFSTLGVQNRVRAELLRVAKQVGAAARAMAEVAVAFIVNSFLAAMVDCAVAAAIRLGLPDAA